MKDLKPCPFCGGEAELHPTYDMDTGEVDGWFTWCNNDRCECKPETNEHFTEAEAIAAWNTRAERVGERKTINKTGDFVTHDSRAERTCRIVKTWSDSDYVDGWRYRCSECGCFIPVNERDLETGDVISAANYCPNCGAKVVGE